MKLTKWFPEGGQNPTIQGVYQVDPFFNRRELRWSYWDGKQFGDFCSDIEDALRAAKQGSYRTLKWRGLVEDPNGSKP